MSKKVIRDEMNNPEKSGGNSVRLVASGLTALVPGNYYFLEGPYREVKKIKTRKDKSE